MLIDAGSNSVLAADESQRAWNEVPSWVLARWTKATEVHRKECLLGPVLSVLSSTFPPRNLFMTVPHADLRTEISEETQAMAVGLDVRSLGEDVGSVNVASIESAHHTLNSSQVPGREANYTKADFAVIQISEEALSPGRVITLFQIEAPGEVADADDVRQEGETKLLNCARYASTNGIWSDHVAPNGYLVVGAKIWKYVFEDTEKHTKKELIPEDESKAGHDLLVVELQQLSTAVLGSNNAF